MPIVLSPILDQPSVPKLEVSIQRIRQDVLLIRRNNATLNRIRMQNLRKPMHDNPPTTLLRQILIPILSIHMFLTKITLLIFKALIIHRDELAENLAFHLLDKVIDGIPVDEVAFLCVVGVQVEVEG